ncbi:MAG: hypothetical protein AAF368_00110 [Planctomycetota bacterium]
MRVMDELVAAFRTALEPLFPRDVAEERARNLAAMLSDILVSELELSFVRVVDALQLRAEFAGVTAPAQVGQPCPFEAAAIRCLKAWMPDRYSAPLSNLTLRVALIQAGVPHAWALPAAAFQRAA